MKFAKELEEDLVPEWRVKYFNYKVGKKKIKAVSRALRAASKTPNTPGRPKFITTKSTDRIPFTHYDFKKKKDDNFEGTPVQQPKNAAQARAQAQRNPALRQSEELDRRQSLTVFSHTPPALRPQRVLEDEPTEDDGDEGTDLSEDSDNEDDEDETPLQKPSSRAIPKGRDRYGSIIGSPPERSTETIPALNLPDPALNPLRQQTSSTRGATLEESTVPSPQDSKLSHAPTNAPEYWDQQSPHPKRLSTLSKRIMGKRSKNSGPMAKSKSKFGNPFAMDSPTVTKPQVDAYRELDTRQGEFFAFLDKELDKIERFYKSKEEEASSRLHVLREQLHEMRDRRLEDLQTVKKGGKIAENGFADGQVPMLTDTAQDGVHVVKNVLKPLTDMFRKQDNPGKTSQAREELGTPRMSALSKQAQNNGRKDYVRKQQGHEKVPYRFARRKLKRALQEFYRGLELMKSYALLNRTAFRKINKKYDKAVNARPPLEYMSEKINGAHFVQSTFVEGTLMNVEDLYARYFERGNKKVAVNKLRSHLHTGDHSAVAFRNGMYVAAGAGFAIAAIIDGSPYLFSNNPTTKTRAASLFQLYGGYFLAVLMFLFFIINCRTWTRARINYTFVFEYDARHTLDWRQLAELPCFFLFLNGLFFWLNFQFPEEHVMYLYWPVLLIGITVVMIFLPFKTLYYDARKWWLYSNWRLLLAGLYPVEFRDFYLGDMYCSETYAMSQIEIFFCLYAHQWNDPPQCNSGHSRLLGFFTALPAVWRALQCLRRYYDSRNWFPHLANFAKYCCNILYYMSLSLYRIHLTPNMRAVFIVFALVNALYCSFWDVFMDFSLGNPWSKHFLLRDNLAFRRKWVYYLVVVFDVVLRQQWVFYAIFTEDLQHSTITSFMVGLAEVFRRGAWSLFRVENEHCNNVQQFRASRDVPLPYTLPESAEEGEEEPQSPKQQKPSDRAGTSALEDRDIERTDTSQSTLRRRRGSVSQETPGLRTLRRVGTVIAAAHAQDFQKKRPVELSATSPEDSGFVGRHVSESSDESEDESRRDSDTALRQLDSREDVTNGGVRQRRRRRTSDIDAGVEDSVGGSASGSQPQSERAGGDVSPARRQASDENAADMSEVRDRVSRARP